MFDWPFAISCFRFPKTAVSLRKVTCSWVFLGRKYPCRGCGIAFPNLVIKAGHVCISTVSGDADEDGSDIGEGDDASSSDTDVPADTDTDDSSEQ